jgi:hypothetical protein
MSVLMLIFLLWLFGFGNEVLSMWKDDPCLCLLLILLILLLTTV